MSGMWYDINHIMSMIDLTWCDIYNTDRYVIRSQAETTEDAESTTEHVRIEQYAIFRFIFSRRKNCIKWTICHVCDTKPTTWCFSSISHDMYTTNCQVCDKKSTTWCYSRGNRTPESEKKQTSVYLMNESSWHDRSRMIRTYNNIRNCMVCDSKCGRPPCFVLRQGPSMPRRNWSIRREEPSFAITADLRPFVTHTGLTVNTALFLLVNITHSSSMKGPRLILHAERELAHPRTTFFNHFSNYSTLRTFSSCCLSLIKEASYTHTVLRYRYCTLL